MFRYRLLGALVLLLAVSCNENSAPLVSPGIENPEVDQTGDEVGQYLPANPTSLQAAIVFDTSSLFLAWVDPIAADSYRVLRSVNGGPWIDARLYRYAPMLLRDPNVADESLYSYAIIAMRSGGSDTVTATARYRSPRHVLRTFKRMVESVGQGEHADAFFDLLSEDFQYRGLKRDHRQVAHGRSREIALFRCMLDPREVRHLESASCLFDSVSVEKRYDGGVGARWVITSKVVLNAAFSAPVLGSRNVTLSHRMSLMLRRSVDGRDWRLVEWKDRR